MTTRELLYIKTIADEGSMTRAAQRLYVTQPSLSHCVTSIENQLGTRLFRRTSGGLLLTDAGEQYYRMACEVLRIYDAFEEEIREQSELVHGRVVMGITNYLAMDELPRMLPAFHKAYPGIDVCISEETTEKMLQNLMNGRLDFAIMHAGAGISDDPALSCEVLGRDPFLIAAPPDNPYGPYAVQGEDGPELDPALLKDEPFLMVAPGQRIRQVTDRVLDLAGVKPKVAFVSKNYELLRRLCAQGMGFTLVPQQYAGIFGGEKEKPCYYRIPQKYGAYWELSIVMLRDAYLSRAAQAFLEAFRKNFEKQ